MVRIEELAAKINEARGLRRERRWWKQMCWSRISSKLDSTKDETKGGDTGHSVTMSLMIATATSEKTNDDDSGIPILRMGNIQNGRLDLRDLKYLHLAERDSAKSLLKRGDILV